MRRVPIALAVLAAALPAGPARPQPPDIAATTIEHTAFGEASPRALADHWGLPEDDIVRYRQYMQVEGRYFYAHLDPVMVLGLIETDPGRRARYAEKYLEGERRRIAEQTGFARLVAAMQRQRSGLEPPVDFATLPQAAHTPEYQAARAARPAPPAPGPATSPPVAATPPALQAGDTVDLWVEAGCEAACYAKLTEVLQTPGVQVRVYGRGFPDAAALVAWLERWPAVGFAAAARADAARRIEPRRFDPVLFAGLDGLRPPVALLRRAGVAMARF
jgi:integrating conjugative element protein (TIGR03759 family)